MNFRRSFFLLIVLSVILIFGNINVYVEESKTKLEMPLKSIIDVVNPYENGKCPTGYYLENYNNKDCYSNFYLKNIKKIKPSEILDNTKEPIIVSSDDSKYDIYVWQDDDTLYYYTEDDYIYLDDNTLLPQTYKIGSYEATRSTYNWQDLIEIDLSKFDTSSVTNMYMLFYGCSKLESLNISNFDLSNVTNTSSFLNGRSNEIPKIIKTPKKIGNNTIYLNNYYFDGNNYTKKITSEYTNKTLNLVYTIVDWTPGNGCSVNMNQSCIIKYLPLGSQKYGELPNLEKDGYTFEGWYKNPYYYDEEHITNDSLLPNEYIVRIGAKYKSNTTDLGIELRRLFSGNFSSSGYENQDCPPGQIRDYSGSTHCHCPFNQYSNIVNFLRADTLDTTKELVKISSRDSLHDVYVWQDGNTMYYYSEDNRIFMQSTEMDYNNAQWYNLENIDLSSFDTSRIDDVSDILKHNNNIKRIVTPKLLAGSTIELPTTLYDSELHSYNYFSHTLKEGTILAKKYVISFEHLNTTKNVLYGSEYGQLPTLSIDGYNFLGWYKDPNYEIPVYANTLFEDDNDIYLYAKLAPKSASLLNANTVSFKDNLSLNFLAEIDESDLDGTYVKFKYNHYGENKELVIPINVNDKNGNYYRFRCELTASEMMIPVTAELYLKDSNEPVSTFTRSIREYIVSGLANSTNEKEKDLFRATLNYGGYTQKRFNYNGEPYAYDNYKDDVSDISITSNITFVRPEGFINGIKYYGSSVFFRNAPYVRYYFELEDGADINNYTFKIGDDVIEPTKKNNKYYIESTPVLAYQLDNKQRLIVKKNNTNVMAFNYSIIKWAEIAAQNTTNDDERNMVKSMYVYYLKAKAFVESNNS